MTREKAIELILARTGPPDTFRGYVERTLDNLGCGGIIDLETERAVEQYIRNDIR